MKIEELRYSKGESYRSIPDDSSNFVKNNDGSVDIAGLGVEETDYTKGSPFLSTRIIFILSGGTKREKDYFRPLKTDGQIHSVKIAFRSKEGQRLKPYELRFLANEFIETRLFVTEDNSTFHIEEDDIIYLLQDVDEFSEEIKGYLKDNEQSNSYQWIISNPSFETWLFYHYYDEPSALSAGLAMSEHDRSNWLKEHLNTIIPGGVKSTQALYVVERAIENSKNNYSEHEGFPSVYSTQMHIVAESILHEMDEEFSQMKKRREEKIEYYKNLGNQEER